MIRIQYYEVIAMAVCMLANVPNCGGAASPPAVPQSPGKLVAVLVEAKLKPAIQPALDQYQKDLEKEGYTVRQLAVTADDDPPKVRAALQGLRPAGLQGAVLVGDIPAIKFNTKTQEGKPYWHDHSCDPYYADLDGEWNDSNHNGTYDEHKGELRAEIWVSRLTPNNPGLGRPAAELLRDYFARNHAFRTGSMEHPPRRAFVLWFTMDILRSTHFAARPSLLYGDQVETFGGCNIPGAADKLRSFLADPRGYELGIINCATFAPIHHFEPDEKKGRETAALRDVWGYTDHGTNDISWAWVAKTKPKTLFYHMLTSEPGRFDYTNYLCGVYLFGANALTIIAGAQHSGAVGTPNVYPDLTAGKTFGETWRDGLNYGFTHAGEKHIEYVCWKAEPEEGVWKGEESMTPKAVLLGDGTLRLSPPTAR